MKKIIALALVFVMLFSLCSCGVKNPYEKELAEANRRSEQAKQAADDAKDAYDQLLKDIEDYEKALEKVQGAK